VAKTVEICGLALESAEVERADVSAVILVGGMTRMPLVQQKVQEYFNLPPSKGVHPDEVVAAGAAIQGYLLAEGDTDTLLLDVTPHHLGIMVAGGLLDVIIEKDTTIPTTETKIFTTVRDNQPQVRIMVLQGDSEKAESNELLGEFVLDKLREAPRGEVKIEVAFDISADGIVSVSAKDVETGRAQSIEVTASSGLTEDEIRAMIAENKDTVASAEASESFDSQRVDTERLLRDIETMLPRAKPLIEDTEFGIEALRKAEQSIQQARGALDARDVRLLEECRGPRTNSILVAQRSGETSELSTESHIEEGLEAYARGDVENALRAWANVDRESAEFGFAVAYLDFVRGDAASLYQSVFEADDPIADVDSAAAGKRVSAATHELAPPTQMLSTQPDEGASSTSPGVTSAAPPPLPSAEADESSATSAPDASFSDVEVVDVDAAADPQVTIEAGEASGDEVAESQGDAEAAMVAGAEEEPPAQDAWGEPDDVVEGGGGFELVDAASEDGSSEPVETASADAEADSSPASAADLEQKLRELLELDDFTGALEHAEAILALEPHHAFAAEAKTKAREQLLQMHYSKLGDVHDVPIVLCPPDQVIWLDLDHRAGFILSQVDGVSSYHEIIEISGMEPLESVTILANLVSNGVIGPASN
jgi:hypothetical protein